jgi:hypothetical protein
MGVLETYNNSTAAKNAAQYQNLTMDQIGKKYGFNFSRDYAKQQADTIASGQTNAQNAAKRENESMNKLNTQRILDNYRSSAKGLDKGYFEQFLGQGQNQANRGLNGGMVADQNLRLAMNKQSELGDLFRTRNQSDQEESMRFSNTNQSIMDSLAQIEKERAMNTEKMYQDGLYRGYDVLSSDRNYGMQLDNNAWGKYMDGLNYNQSLKRSSGGGGGGSRGSYTTSTTPLSNSKSSFDSSKSKAQTNIGKYNTANTPVPYNQRYLYNEYGLAPKSVANNPNISYYDKMKLLGG